MKALRIVLLVSLAPVGVIALAAVVATVTVVIACIGAARIIVDTARS
jgi:hypothetical protein